MDADEEDMHEVRPFLARLRLDVVWVCLRSDARRASAATYLSGVLVAEGTLESIPFK